MLLSKEEREANLLNKFKMAISRSLENLNIKNLIDVKAENDKESILDDDNVSVTSSRYFASGVKTHKNLKLPFIIGTQEFFKNEYLGIGDLGQISTNSNIGESEGIQLERKISTVSQFKNSVQLEEPGTITTSNNNVFNNNVTPQPNLNQNILNNPTMSNQTMNSQITNNQTMNNQPRMDNKSFHTKNIPKAPPLPSMTRKIPSKTISNVNMKTNNLLSEKQEEILDFTKSNLPTLNNNEMIISNNLNQNNSNNPNPISFKDNLAKMLGGPSSNKLPIQNTNTNITTNITTNNFEVNESNNLSFKPPQNNIPNQDINKTNNQPLKYVGTEDSSKPKQIKLDQFIRNGSSLFSSVEDDEEDNTGLFNKTFEKRQIRNTLFDINVVSQVLNEEKNKEPTQEVTSRSKTLFKRNDMTTIEEEDNYNQDSKKETKENRESKTTSQFPFFKKETDFDLPNNKTQKSMTFSSKETKTNNLEKAKSNLLKMFDDDEEEDFTSSKPSIVSSKINEKTSDLNNKLSLILGDKKDELKSIKKQEVVAENPFKSVNEKPPVVIANTTISNGISNNKDNQKPIAKKPIFLDDDEDTLFTKPSLIKQDNKKSDKKEKVISDPLSVGVKPKIKDPLSALVNSNSGFKTGKSKFYLTILKGDNQGTKLKETGTQNKLNEGEKENKNTFVSNKPDEGVKENLPSVENIEGSKTISSENKLSENNPESKNKVSIEDDNSNSKNSLSNFKNMLGGKISFPPMMGMKPQDISITNENRSSHIKEKEENQEKTYESILQEKTAVVNKRKPKLTLFNRTSQLDSSESNSQRESLITAFNPVNILINDTQVPFAGNSDLKIKEEFNLPSPIEEKTNKKVNIFEEIPENRTPIKSKNLFEEIQDIKDTNSSNKKENKQPVKKPLFDFDDEEVDTYPKKKETSQKDSKLNKNNKIQFLFDD